MTSSAADTARAESLSASEGLPSPVRHLETIRTAIESDRAVADLLGVSPSQITRWRKGQVPDVENADRLAGLALVVEMMCRWLRPDLVHGWLEGIDAHLQDRAPAYMLRHGRLAEVIGAIEAMKAGVHA